MKSKIWNVIAFVVLCEIAFFALTYTIRTSFPWHIIAGAFILPNVIGRGFLWSGYLPHPRENSS